MGLAERLSPGNVIGVGGGGGGITMGCRLIVTVVLFLCGAVLMPSPAVAVQPEVVSHTSSAAAAVASAAAGHKFAYVTMMYMGTPRDYEFYVAIRVMLRSLLKLGVNADLVVIASLDVPLRWVQAL